MITPHDPSAGRPVARGLGAAVLAAMGLAAGVHGVVGLRDATRVPPAIAIDAISATAPSPGSKVTVVGAPIADTMVRWTETRSRWGGLQSNSSHAVYVPLARAGGADGAPVRVFVLVYPREGSADVSDALRATRFSGVVSDTLPERVETMFRQRLRVDPRVILIDTHSEDRLSAAGAVALGLVLLAWAFLVARRIHPRGATPWLLWRLEHARRTSSGWMLVGLSVGAAFPITILLGRAPGDAPLDVVIMVILGASALLALGCGYLFASTLVRGVERDVPLRSTLRRLGLSLPQLAERVERELTAAPGGLALLSRCLLIVSPYAVSIVAYDDIAELELQASSPLPTFVVHWVVDDEAAKGRRWICAAGAAVTREEGAAIMEGIMVRAPWAALGAPARGVGVDERLRAYDARRASTSRPAAASSRRDVA